MMEPGEYSVIMTLDFGMMKSMHHFVYILHEPAKRFDMEEQLIQDCIERANVKATADHVGAYTSGRKANVIFMSIEPN